MINLNTIRALLEDVRTAVTAAMGTAATGVGTILDKIPLHAGAIASIVGSISTIIFVVLAVRRDRRESRANALQAQLIREQMLALKRGDEPPDDL